MATLDTSDASIAPLPRGVTMERTFAGLEARLHSSGLGRFLSAAFLGGWLVFWLVGECFVLWILGVGGWSLLTGNPPGPGRAPLALAPSLAVGAFLLAWLGFWTLGGIAAFAEFSRLLWSVDRLRANAHEMHVIRRAGFFVRRRHVPREHIRRLYRIEDSPTLMVETREGAVELTRLGSPDQQDQILAAFTAELKLPAAGTLSPVLPPGWTKISAPEGGVLLVKDPATRRIHARITWLVALPLGVAAVIVLKAAVGDRQLIPLAVLLVVPAALALYGAIRYQWSRREWRIETGRIVQQRRFGSHLQPELAATAIQLTESRDSDGDRWYALQISAPVSADATAAVRRRSRRTLLSRLHDGTEPRRLAEWLAAATGLSLLDSTSTPASKTVERAELVAQLQRSGRFGRWAARWIGRKE